LYPAFVSLSISIVQTKKPTSQRRDENHIPKTKDHLSPDGNWRSFPRVPNLLQYVGTGQYFARVKVRGKLIRRKLDTDVFSTAKLRLGDFIKKEKSKRPSLDNIETFGQAQALYEADLAVDHGLSGDTKRYRTFCIKKLNETWTGLAGTKLARITETDCKAWAGKLASQIDAQYFNNVLGTFRAILKRGGIAQADDPSRDVKRLSVEIPEVILPSLDKFNALLVEMENGGARQSKDCADFARGLAFSGCRLSEARRARPADCDFEKGIFTIHGSKIRKSGKLVVRTRKVPMNEPLRELLTRLVERAGGKDGPLFRVGECEKSLVRACKVVGIEPLTHHQLRDMFATRAIECGVDIPTLAEWLGHADRGALLLRRYHKYREEHGKQQAEKMTFANGGAR
jgi:integrase